MNTNTTSRDLLRLLVTFPRTQRLKLEAIQIRSNFNFRNRLIWELQEGKFARSRIGQGCRERVQGTGAGRVQLVTSPPSLPELRHKKIGGGRIARGSIKRGF